MHGVVDNEPSQLSDDVYVQKHHYVQGYKVGFSCERCHDFVKMVEV